VKVSSSCVGDVAAERSLIHRNSLNRQWTQSTRVHQVNNNTRNLYKIDVGTAPTSEPTRLARAAKPERFGKPWKAGRAICDFSKQDIFGHFWTSDQREIRSRGNEETKRREADNEIFGCQRIPCSRELARALPATHYYWARCAPVTTGAQRADLNPQCQANFAGENAVFEIVGAARRPHVGAALRPEFTPSTQSA